MAKDSDNYFTVKEHFKEILQEKDKAIAVAMAAAKEAVGVAEKNSEKWRDNANEWRGAMTDREEKFALKTDIAIIKEAMEKDRVDTDKKLDELKNLVSKLIGNKEGMKDKWGWVFGAIGLLLAILGWTK